MSQTEIEIREFYNGYGAPTYVAKTVRTLLSTVPPKYLSGIDCVVLTNLSGLPRKDRRKHTPGKRRHSQSHTVGLYSPASPGKPASIKLFVDMIVLGLGKYRYIPFFRKVVFGHVLFHEIGHHVHATIRPEFADKEGVADDWGKKFVANFFRTKYWFLIPVSKPFGRMLRLLARTL